MIEAQRRRIKRLFSAAGIHLRPAKSVRPIDMTSCMDVDPISAVYGTQGRQILLRVPLSRCLHYNWLAFPCCSNSVSPAIQTLIRYGAGLCRSYAGSPLEAFYNGYQPANAAAAMDLQLPTWTKFEEIRPAGALFPWRSGQPERSVLLRNGQITAENKEHGARFDYSDGDQFHGPVSFRKGELEFRRLAAIYTNLQKNGFRYDAQGVENIGVTCLFSDQFRQWKFMVATAGHHRLAAAAASGYTDVVVQLSSWGHGGIVRRSDVRSWPAVQDGYFKESEALTIFDRLFEGKQPALFCNKISLGTNVRSDGSN